MKNFIINILHLLFGYERYLRFFAQFKIRFLGFDERKKDYSFYEKSLSDTANILVIGASIGITTVPFAKEKPDRTVYAYEPLQSNFSVLQSIIQHYQLSNVRLYNLGLGDRSCSKEMVLPIFKGARKHGMAYINVESIAGVEKGIKSIATIDRLDNREELRGISIQAIKIVAENYEFEILTGAKQLLNKHKPTIYCELWHNPNRLKVLQLVRDLDYLIYFRKEKELLLYDGKNYSGKNFFFLPQKL